MIWLIIIVIPICVELAGWVVDATYLEREVAQTEDVELEHRLSSEAVTPNKPPKMELCSLNQHKPKLFSTIPVARSNFE